MKARIERGESGGVCFLNLSRFGRNRNVAGDILKLEALGGTVISVEDNIDTSSPSGALMLDIMSAFNVYYLANVTAGWKRTHDNMVERGAKSGPCPVGYVRHPAVGKYAVPLALDDVAAPVVRAGFELRASGASFVKVALLFTQAGLRTAHGNTVWTDDGARSVIENEAYMGWSRHGKNRVNKNAHDPIVTPALWRKANAVSSVSKLRGTQHNDETGGILAKLLTCPTCNGHLTQATDGRGYRNYLCKNKRCSSRVSIKADGVENYVVDAILDHMGTLTYERVVGGDTDVTELQDVVDAAHAECEQFADEMGIDVEELPTNARQVKALREAEDALAAAIGESAHTIEKTLDLSDPDFRSIYSNSPIPVRRSWIARHTEEIVVSKSRGRIEERVTIAFAA